MGLGARLLAASLSAAAGAGEGYLEHQKRLEEIRRTRFQQGQERERTGLQREQVGLEGRRTAADERRATAYETNLGAQTLSDQLRGQQTQAETAAYNRLTPEQQSALQYTPQYQAESGRISAEASRTSAVAQQKQQERLGAAEPSRRPVPEWNDFVAQHPFDYLAILEKAHDPRFEGEVLKTADFQRWMERKDVTAFFAKYSAIKAEEAAFEAEDDLGGGFPAQPTAAQLGAPTEGPPSAAPRPMVPRELGAPYQAQPTPAVPLLAVPAPSPAAAPVSALQQLGGSIGPQARQAIAELIRRGKARNEQEAIALLEGGGADLSQ